MDFQISIVNLGKNRLHIRVGRTEEKFNGSVKRTLIDGTLAGKDVTTSIGITDKNKPVFVRFVTPEVPSLYLASIIVKLNNRRDIEFIEIRSLMEMAMEPMRRMFKSYSRKNELDFHEIAEKITKFQEGARKAHRNREMEISIV